MHLQSVKTGEEDLTIQISLCHKFTKTQSYISLIPGSWKSKKNKQFSLRETKWLCDFVKKNTQPFHVTFAASNF